MKHERKSQIQTDHNLLKLWPKIFIKKNPNFRKICYTSDTNKKHFPKPWWSSQLQKLRDERERFYKIFRKTNREQHLIQWKKQARAEFNSLAKKNKKENWKKFASSLNSNTPIKQAWNRIRQLKDKDPEKVNTLEVNGTQYKDSKSITNKIGKTLAELYLPQNYDSTFLDLKQREEQKTLHVKHADKENNNKYFSKDELSQAIQAGKNSAPGPDKATMKCLNTFFQTD